MLDDIAFAVMDFDARGRHDLAFRLLNQWLDHSGDHAALPALRFSIVYRALVRAQVAQLRAHLQHEADAVARTDVAASAHAAMRAATVAGIATFDIET